jgi:TPR repeat protein
MVEPSGRDDGVRKTEDQLRADVEKLSEQLRALGVAPFSGLPLFNRSQTKAHQEFLDVSFLSVDFGGSVDFRAERFRRALLAGKTPASLRCDGRYTGGNSSETHYFLGRALAMIREWNDPEALVWFESAASGGHIEASARVWNSKAGQHWVGELNTLQGIAEGGDGQAARILVYVCRWSSVPAMPYVVKYLTEGVARGDRFSELYLAEGYRHGCFGLRPDHELAFKLYLKAAEKGDPQAQCALGVYCATGHGREKDESQAVHWYERAARSRHPEAMGYLGYSYMVGRAPLKQSVREANRWCRRAALRGDPGAQYLLGLSYLRGTALPANEKLATKWFGRAARASHVEATYELGESYYSGRGIAVSYANAANLYGVAARGGHLLAQCRYADMLYAGIGTQKNLEEASYWYREAVKQGILKTPPTTAGKLTLVPR